MSEGHCGTTSKVFRKYKNPVFIESGSFLGNGIDQALRAGFRKVYSIELSRHYFELVSKRFCNNRAVTIIHGDSSIEITRLLKNINERVTFWLDAHYSGQDTARGSINSPILHELDAIKQHHIKSHTILIDDVRLFSTNDFDFVTKEQILKKIYEINPDYVIVYEDGFVPNDVLVAYIPETQKLSQ